MLNIIKTTLVIIGTIIGAGFSSGQEILTFFNKYGFFGLIGLIVSMGFIGIIIYKTFRISIKEKINLYQNFVERILPSKLKQNTILIFTINNIINIFLFISFNIMVAGFSTYFYQEFKIPKIIGSIVIAIISYVIFLKGINGIVKINIYLIPVILILILVLGIEKIDSISIIQKNKSTYWYISSILYASYNSICLIPILINLKGYLHNKKKCGYVAFFSFLIMLVLSLTIFFILNSNFFSIVNVEIPIVFIAGKMGIFWKYVYGIYILMAILTTALSSGFAFLNNIGKSRKAYWKIGLMMCIVSILFGQFEFSKLITIIYPIFGLLGIIQIIFLLIA